MGRFAALEYRDSHKGIKRRDGPANGLYGGFAFWGLLRPAGHGRKNAACGLWRVYKRRKDAGEYRDKGGHVGGLGGHKKPAPGKPRAGYGGILTDVAISADVCAVLDAGIND